MAELSDITSRHDAAIAAMAKRRTGKYDRPVVVVSDLGKSKNLEEERSVFNAIGLTLACKFETGEWDYEFCDCVANDLWWLMLDRLDAPHGEKISLAETMSNVFFAFDDGEYRRPGDPKDLDPIAFYTVPEIKRILSQHTESKSEESINGQV
ncbi:hypothetical protein [Parasedimentitalea huanghaiensis]|uniref:Uncharacterized protein n=1 Tax=Parasedimentitalea huanghaiensis TaxID=2682100 RepID=A0A6L6WH75_9RHOB|nr:hypothetical protein [Zongyanglinia huanghaiensis]MVO15397.1 hypothetical protein [Zongyanglinia huanghaiensis]